MLVHILRKAGQLFTNEYLFGQKSTCSSDFGTSCPLRQALQKPLDILGGGRWQVSGIDKVTFKAIWRSTDRQITTGVPGRAALGALGSAFTTRPGGAFVKNSTSGETVWKKVEPSIRAAVKVRESKTFHKEIMASKEEKEKFQVCSIISVNYWLPLMIVVKLIIQKEGYGSVLW